MHSALTYSAENFAVSGLHFPSDLRERPITISQEEKEKEIAHTTP